MSRILQEAAAGRATIVPWTVEQYHRAIETGFLSEDTSVERVLIRENLSGNAYARVTRYVRGETLLIAAGSAQVSLPAERLLP